jgi:ATP/maltotriose-dependent transcriptional regulator MalT
VAECARVEQLLGRHEDAGRRLLEAWAAHGDEDSPATVDLLIDLGVDAFYRTNYQAMRGRGHQALGMARRTSDRRLVAAACALLALADAFTGAIEEAERHRAAAAVLIDAMSDEDLATRLDSVTHLGAAELYLDRYADAKTHLKRGLAEARRTNRLHLFPVLIPALAATMLRRGELTDAATLLDAAIEGARLAGDVQALAWTLLDRAFAACLAGDLVAAQACAEESVALAGELDESLVSANAGAVLAEVLMERGDAARAAQVLVSAGGGESLERIQGALRIYYLELLARCRLDLGAIDGARSAATQAQASVGDAPAGLGSALAGRATAAVALAEGRIEQAAHGALASAATAERIEARLEAARSRLLAGSALARLGERERAVAELEAAVVTMGACGASRHRQRAERALGTLGRRPPRPRIAGTGLGSLSARELEVARLVVDRRTNAEIATELFLSIKTVETHLRHIFEKLDAASRIDVARTIEQMDRATAADGPVRH